MRASAISGSEGNQEAAAATTACCGNIFFLREFDWNSVIYTGIVASDSWFETLWTKQERFIFLANAFSIKWNECSWFRTDRYDFNLQRLTWITASCSCLVHCKMIFCNSPEWRKPELCKQELMAPSSQIWAITTISSKCLFSLMTKLCSIDNS